MSSSTKMTQLSSRGISASVLSLVCLLGAILLSGAEPPGQLCQSLGTGKPTCVCNHTKGIIDLTPLDSSVKSGSARFLNVGPDENEYLYDYNPCSTFTSKCGSAYVCQHDSDNNFLIGDVGSEGIYIDEDKKVYAYYKADAEGGNEREAFVELVCQQGLGTGHEKIETEGDSKTALHYEFTLTSCHACPGGCTSSGGSIAGIIGIVLILCLIIALVLYFIIGAVILKVHFQKTGSDIIPNKGFWFALPVLIKDGCLFTISPCKRLIKRKEYEEM